MNVFSRMTNCVYRIECLNPEIKEIYIGSTKDLDERIKHHKKDCKNSNSKVYKFIREHGDMDNWKFDIELLTTGFDREQRLEMEQNYIDCLKPQLNSKNAKSIDTEKQKKNNRRWFSYKNKVKVI